MKKIELIINYIYVVVILFFLGFNIQGNNNSNIYRLLLEYDLDNQEHYFDINILNHDVNVIKYNQNSPQEIKLSVDNVDSFYSDCIKNNLSSILGEYINDNGNKVKLIFYDKQPIYYEENNKANEVYISLYKDMYYYSTKISNYIFPFISSHIKTYDYEKGIDTNIFFYSNITIVGDENMNKYSLSIVPYEFRSIISINSYEDMKKLFVNNIKEDIFSFDDTNKKIFVYPCTRFYPKNEYYITYTFNSYKIDYEMKYPSIIKY